MFPIRIFYNKTGRAKYTSHLDTMRTLTRAFRRSELPLWFTEGFNPHLYMTFALPIPLGYESKSESVDLRLMEDIPKQDVLAALNKALPPGFEATKVAVPSMDPNIIAWAEYEIVLVYKEKSLGDIIKKLETMLALPVLYITKKTKKGEKEIDILPHIKVLGVKEDDYKITVNFRSAAGNSLNITPTPFLKLFYSFSNILPDGVKITRTKLLDEGFNEFY